MHDFKVRKAGGEMPDEDMQPLELSVPDPIDAGDLPGEQLTVRLHRDSSGASVQGLLE